MSHRADGPPHGAAPGHGRHAGRSFITALAPLLLCGALSACVSGVSSLETHLRTAGYEVRQIRGTLYKHQIFRAPHNARSEVLNVYIEHDGHPWVDSGRRPVRDPTPRHPVMLALMKMDPAPRLFLGRPCYFGLWDSEHCNALVWTHERYSEKVVESMAAALRSEIARTGVRTVRLFGHSGGGTLAVLLAYRIPQVKTVLTLSANLAVAQWARAHGYSPLAGSLDPMDFPPLPDSIEQRHYVGARDANTPPELLETYARSHPQAVVRRIDKFDHLCCWEGIWPSLLRALTPAVAEGQ